ncbi:site-specific integrase [Acetatifactor muris]|nr:site-specific integrase [Acetatifactor muris]
MEQKTEEKLTPEVLETFLTHLSDRGCSHISLQEYRRTLNGLYEYLSEEKIITAQSGLLWRQWLEEQEFSTRTINTRVSVWNSLMRYLGHRDWQVSTFSNIEDVQPELTRNEYLRLLSTAKQLGQEKTYLLIKTLGGVGLRLQELPQLTAAAVR